MGRKQKPRRKSAEITTGNSARTVCSDPLIILEQTSSFHFCLWISPEIAHDLIAIELKRICRETERATKGGIIIDSSKARQGYIRIGCNPTTKYSTKQNLDRLIERIIVTFQTTPERTTQPLIAQLLRDSGHPKASSR